MFPFCSVIVLNYNGKHCIGITFNSLIKLNYPTNRYEIIVVDNGSTDDSVSTVEKIQNLNPKLQANPKIQILKLKQNIGFAGGNNEGIRKAKGKYVVLLNNDCTVDRNWLKELVAVAEKDEKIFAVNPKVYLGETNKIQNAGIRVFANGYSQDRGAEPKNNVQDYEDDKGQYDKKVPVDAVCAVASLYRKKTLEKIGLLDDSFFLYYEDVELSLRAKKAGYKLIYAPKAIARHLHSASSVELSPFFIYHAEKGRLLLLILQFPLKVFFAELLKFSAKSVLRLLYGVKNPKRFLQQLQYFKVFLFFLFLWPYFLGRRKAKQLSFKVL